MEQGFGNESPRRHTDHSLRKTSRYLVLIGAGGSAVAKLFLDNRELAAEFDASTEETALMTRGLSPVTGAEGAEWDKALRGHSADERREATVYTLDV